MDVCHDFISIYISVYRALYSRFRFGKRDSAKPAKPVRGFPGAISVADWLQEAGNLRTSLAQSRNWLGISNGL